MAALFLVVQFIPVDRTNPPVQTELQAHEEVMTILHNACFDCHSHETIWPWYSRIAPFSWVLASHVMEGRKDLNFSIWPAFNFQKQELIFREMEKQIENGVMPPGSYTLGHPEARLSEDERQVLLKWIREGFSNDADLNW